MSGIDAYTKLMLHMDGDQSSSNHIVTHNGNTVYNTTTKKFGVSSLYFDGASDYLTSPDSDDWCFSSGDFTIDFWINFATMPAVAGVIINQWSVDKRSFVLSISAVSGNNYRISAGYSTDGTNTTDLSGCTATFMQTGTWYHIAMVRNGNLLRYFIDGVAKGTDAITGTLANVADVLTIGRHSGQSSYYTNAYIDELRLSKGTARWTTGFTPPTSAYSSDASTKLLLHFNGDESNSHHQLTTNGDPQLNASVTKWNGSMHLDGTGDYLTVADSDDWCFGTGDLTIDFWVRFDSLPSSQYYGIMGQRYNWDNNNAFSVVYTDIGGNVLSIAFNNQSVGYVISWTPSTDTWYHIALVRNSNAFYTFIDGVNKDTLDVTGLDVINSNQPMAIGTLYVSGASYYPFPGYFDEIRISKGIARWTSNFTPPTSAYSSGTSYNISKFMGADFANISKIVGVSTSNIDKFLGVGL